MVPDAFRPSSSAPKHLAGNDMTRHDSELIELLKGLAGESGQKLAPEVFSERLDLLGLLLARHINTEEQHSYASCLSVPCNKSHIKEHSLMLEQYVQWQFDLMKMNSSPRSEICKKIEEWLACHAFASGVAYPESEAGPLD